MATTFLRRPWTLGRNDLAVDLGTANTVVYKRGTGIVLFEPSVVAIDETTERIHAIGEDARRMIGRTPATIRATRPLRHGVIADFEITEQMLRYFIRKTAERRRGGLRVIVCVPTGVTEVERRAVEEATLAAGARRAHLIEEPLAAAIGAGLPVGEPRGNFVVDIGGGTSEMAVVALGGMVVSRSLRVGGYELDDALVRHCQQNLQLLVGSQQAERVKIEIGSATPQPGEETREATLAGRDLTTGLLRRATLDPREVRDAMARPISQIVEAVKDTLEQTPPELSADLSELGIVLVGGGALLPGMDELLRRETGLPVQVADSPLLCVAIGAGHGLEELTALDRVAAGRRRG